MTRNKWKSRRFLVAIWAAALATYIVMKEQDAFLEVAKWCVGIVAIWAGFESILKKWLPIKKEGE